MPIKQLIFIIALVSLSSCATSLVYSPSVGLTTKPLKQGDIDLKGAAILLPETRPSSIGVQTSLGGEAHIAYGFTDKFALQVKGWAAVTPNNVRMGYSLAGIRTLKETEKLRLILMPRVGVALSGNSIEGYGLELPLILQYNENANTTLFVGLGGAFGFSQLEKMNKNAGFASGLAGDDFKYPYGYAALLHTGLMYRLTRQFRINLELSGIYQLNTFDNQRHYLLSPNVGIGYTIAKREK
jgi:hypothetical protein